MPKQLENDFTLITFTPEQKRVSVSCKSELENEYNSKSVEELAALKKKLYSNVDIESPMSDEEKIITKVIAKKFSEKNEAIREKREAAKINHFK